MKGFLKRLTVFDRVVILIAIVGLLFFIYILSRKPTTIVATVKVGDDNVVYNTFPWRENSGIRPWFSEMFYRGMKEKDGLGRTNAEVLSVSSYDIGAANRSIYLKVRLKTVFSRSNGQYTYKGMPVLVGFPVRLYLDFLKIDGLVTSIEGKGNVRSNQKLHVGARVIEENPIYLETSGINDFLAEAIKEGDEIKSGNGEVVLKIIEKKVEPAKRTVFLADGSPVLELHPTKKDVYLRLEVNSVKVGNQYFIYDDFPILVGQKIPIGTSLYSITPQITDIKIIE